MIADLETAGERTLVAGGGRGGRGNTAFKSATNRAPREAESGMLGEEQWLWLKLKLIADAGIVGLPNAGKSTLLGAATRAKPKIADYPFTTLYPALGVVAEDNFEFELADVPGLIEGAHQGRGLGHRFLGHVERCEVLIHVVDALQEDLFRAYRMVREELGRYSSRGFLSATQSLATSISGDDILPSRKVGLRPQLVRTDTLELVMDFVLETGESSLHVLNAISPAFTSSLRLAQLIVDRAES